MKQGVSPSRDAAELASPGRWHRPLEGESATGAPGVFHVRHWIAVACADHVARGVAGGFMQVCHGKSAPLARIQPGDQVVYYSPTQQMGRPDGLQCFTALGAVQPTAPYRFDMGGGFVPWRRDVDWQAGTAPAAIRPLLAQLEFTQGQKNWAAPLRFGLLRISAQDMACIAAAMGITALPHAAAAPPASAPHTPSLWPELPAR